MRLKSSTVEKSNEYSSQCFDLQKLISMTGKSFCHREVATPEQRATPSAEGNTLHGNQSG